MARKILSVFLVILLAPLFFGVIFGFAFRATLANPDFVKKELADFGAYEKIYRNLPEIVGTTINKSEVLPGEGQDQEEQSPLTPEETVAVAQKAVSPNDLKLLSESAIDGIWPWLFGTKSELKTNTSLAGIKQKAEAEILNGFRAKYNVLPVCSYYDTESGGDITACRPRGVSFDQALAEYQKMTGSTSINFLSNIPDTFEPETAAQNNPELSKNLQNIERARPIISLASSGIYILALILIVVLVFIARLFGGEWGKAPRAFGILLVFVGGLSFIYGFFVIKIILPRIVLLTDQIQIMPTLKKELVTPLVGDATSKVYGVFNNYIYALLAIGAMFIIGSLIYELFARWHTRRAGWSIPKEAKKELKQ